MEQPPNENLSRDQILSRIEWCWLQRKGAVTRDEEEGWYAEEAGLIDALLGRDRTEITHPCLLSRYQLGLRDGQALLHFPHNGREAVRCEINEGSVA